MNLKEAIEKLKNPDQFFAKQFKQLLEEFKEELEELKQQKDELLAIDKEEIIDEILKEVKSNLKDEKFLKVFDNIRGKDGEQGLKGDKGDRGDRGLQGIPSKDGKDGKTGKDGEQGFRGEKGLIGETGKSGKDGSPDTPEEIAKKLNKTEESVKISVIKGLETYLKKLGQSIQQKTKGGGGMGLPIHQTFACNGVLTSFTLSNNVAANGNAAWIYYQGQFLVKTTHWAISGKILSLTFTPENGTNIDITYIRT